MSLEPDNQFRAGFSLGMAFSCMDLCFAQQSKVLKAVYYDRGLGGLKMPINLQQGTAQPVRMDMCFPVSCDDANFASRATFGVGELMLYWMKLHLVGDPRKDDVVISLLTGSWKDIGLEGYEFTDCRECLCHYGVEVLESLCENFVGEVPVGQGLYLGRGVSEMLTVIKAGKIKTGMSSYYSKAQFLNDLGS